jgi:hypothetical protein
MMFAFKVWGPRTLAAAIFAVGVPGIAQEPAAQDAAAQVTAPTFKAEELDALIAPVALYPDPLLAQIFMAATHPLEVVEAARWQKEHAELKDKALEDALQAQTWDPSVKSLTAFPQVLTMMNEKLDWTQKLATRLPTRRRDARRPAPAQQGKGSRQSRNNQRTEGHGRG